MTLTELFHRTVERVPDAVATIETLDGAPVTTTYAELGDEVGQARTRLVDHGIRPGDRVAYWAENRREFFVWHLACAAEAAVLVGTNTRYRAVEVAHVLSMARPRLVVMPASLLGLDLVGTLHDAVSRAGTDAASTPPQVAVLGVITRAGQAPDARATEDLARFDLGAGAWWADEPAETRSAPPVGASDDLTMTFTTSGSTGMPKLAAHDQAAVAGHAEAVADAIGCRSGDVICCALPLTGVFAYVPALAAVAAGVTSLMVPVFDGAVTIGLMAQHDVTHVFGGDDLFVGLHSGWQAEKPQLPSWRIAGVASFVGRVEQLVPWLEACSGARMCGVYGSSEVFSLLSLRDLGSPSSKRHLGGGRLVGPAYDVRVVDSLTRVPVPAGEVGALEFRGPNVLQRYLKGDEETSPELREGWFDSGDLGFVEDDARVFTYEGRAGDALRLRGFLVQPSEIELFLVEHPDVDMVKVVGAESAGRPVALAFVTAAPGADPATLPTNLLTWCRAELAAFKVPERIVVIGEMPLTSGTNGSKIKTAELRNRAAALLG